MRATWLALALVGCGDDKSTIQLLIDPAKVELGELSFDGEMPDGGYASFTVRFTNTSGFPVDLTLQAWDEDHLCLDAFPDADADTHLALLDDGAFYELTAGVCAYLPGEATTEVSTALTVLTDGTPPSASVPITFTPLRGVDDSG